MKVLPISAVPGNFFFEKIKNQLTRIFLRLWDDGVIDPKDSRKILGLSLAAALNNADNETKYGVFRM